jgi:hypothetical protein
VGLELVPMTKDGQTLEVHPSCVADHKRQGWVEAPAESKESTHKRGRKAASEE